MKTKLKTLAILALCIMMCHQASAQLSGNYTINSGAATGGTNFTSFADFSSALSSGVSGPVVVNVAASSGPYSEMVTFTEVTGASSTNTITINGNGETLVNNSATTGFVIRLNGADHFIFDDLRIEAASNIAGTRCFWIRNQSDYNVIRNCELVMPNYDANTNSGTYISFTTSATASASGYHGSNNVIEFNKMWNGGNPGKGPDAGIRYWAASEHENYDVNMIVRLNEIRDVRRSFVNLVRVRGFQFTANYVHTAHVSAEQVSVFHITRLNTSQSSIQNRIDSNLITNLHARFVDVGRFNLCSGASDKPLAIVNNHVRHNSAIYTFNGLSIQNSSFVDIVTNYIYLNSSEEFMYNIGWVLVVCSNVNLIGNNIYGNQADYLIESLSFMYTCDHVTYLRNRFTLNDADDASDYMMYFYDIDSMIFSENEIYQNMNVSDNWYKAELLLEYCQNIEIYNNLLYENITGNEHSAVYLNETSNVSVFHNTFYWNAIGAGDIAWFISNDLGDSAISFNSNILYCNWNDSGSISPITCEENSDLLSWENNVIYDGTGGTLSYSADGSSYSSFADWASAVGDGSSVIADPEFEDVSSRDYHPTNPDIDNMATPGLVSFDFEGNTRGANPDPGALEFEAFVCNLSSSLLCYPDSSTNIIGSLNTYAASNQMYLSYGPQNMIIECNSSGGSDNSYDFSGMYLSEGDDDSSIVFTPEAAGVYTIICIVESGECADTNEIEICVIDATGHNPNNNNYKVKICHQPDDPSSNAVTISISINAVQTHLTGHDGCRLGGCDDYCGSTGTPSQQSYDSDQSSEAPGYGEFFVVQARPNPSSSGFDIVIISELENPVEVKMFDMTGRLIQTLHFQDSHHNISVGDSLPSGIYFITVKQGDQYRTLKLVKE